MIGEHVTCFQQVDKAKKKAEDGYLHIENGDRYSIHLNRHSLLKCENITRSFPKLNSRWNYNINQWNDSMIHLSKKKI